MGFWKNLFTLGALAGVGYLGVKGYQRVNDGMKLSKTLPDYLKDILNEKPNINIHIRLNTMSIAVGLSAETYENLNFDLEEHIDNYIADYYPNLAKLSLTITKYIKATDTEEKDDEDNLDECQCGNDCDEE